MIEVDAQVRYWTPIGMQNVPIERGGSGYIAVPEVEHLLEEAYQRGYQDARREVGQ